MRGWNLIIIAIAASVTISAARADQDGFLEEFETLDRARWFVSDGWVNGPHQNCLWSESAVQVEGGVLRLLVDQADDGPEEYICAEIQSVERFSHGVFEASMRVPFASGTNSNFFTFIGPPQGVPHNEIDFEFIARTGPVLQTNTFVDGAGGNEALLPVPDNDEWLDLAFIWEPDQLRWFLNGELIRTVEGDKVPGLTQKMFLSIWTTGMLTEWMGNFEWTEPLELEIDRVAFTPLGAGCHFDASILCSPEFRADATADNN